MGRAIHRLSAVRLKKLPPQRVMLPDGGGLYLSVIPPNASSWVFRYMASGRQRVMGLGSYPAISLGAARELAADARKLRAQGRDPLGEKRAQAASARTETAKLVTFDQCAADYIEAHRASWTNAKHFSEWKATLATYTSPIIGKLPVGAIDTALVMKVLRQTVERPAGTTDLWLAIPETASRLRGRIESILDYAIVHEYRQGENPASWKRLKHLLPARNKLRDVKHLDAMDYRTIADFMVELRSLDSVDARAMEFVILTAGRSGEVLGAKWSEIDLAARTWTVPGNRMKGGRPHRSVLSDAAIAVLPPHAGEEFVFGRRVGRRHADPDRQCRIGGLPYNALRALMTGMGRPETVHGFRATFKTWATECTAYPRELIEVALAHVQTDALELAYQRGEQIEKRRKLMQDWAQHCAGAKP